MSSFDFETWLTFQQKRVEGMLRARLQSLKSNAPLLEAMEYSLLAGGKRLRPILCVAMAEGVGSMSKAGALLEDAACAIEYLHTYSLIHDDLPAMDNADLRRGRPTSHKKFGEAMAILAGDALLTEAFALLAGGGATQEDNLRCRLVGELAVAAGAGGMVAGQVLDVSAARPSDEKSLTELQRLKTGALIRAACRMGAWVGQASPEELLRASRYGEAIGLAFQITDDILDVTSDAARLGKNAQVDAALAKTTFPGLLGLSGAQARAASCVEEALRCVEPLEPEGGPLTALARFSVERGL